MAAGFLDLHDTLDGIHRHSGYEAAAMFHEALTGASKTVLKREWSSTLHPKALPADSSPA
jgi:hypothetical protein